MATYVDMMSSERSWRLSLPYLGCLLLLISGGESRVCRLPRHWHGRWFQSQVGDLVINEEHIGGKGRCLEKKRDFYLLVDDSRHCHTCLMLMERHSNVLQYKESNCLQSNNLKAVCPTITPEYPLHTLIKDSAIPVACPFHGSFQMTYNINTDGMCPNLESTVLPCAGDSLLSLHFAQCPSIPEKDMELQCLATWKNGSDMFLYGRLLGGTDTSRDDQNRCFMFQPYGSAVHVSMSADASCRGLRSPSDGPLTMMLHPVPVPEVQGSCSFPRWLRGSTWSDLRGRHRYVVDADGHTINSQYHSHLNGDGQVTLSLRCLHASRNDRSEFHAIIHTRHGCASYYQCIRIAHVAAGVVELRQGGSSSTMTGYCGDTNWNITRILLIDERKSRVSCPYDGEYTLSGREELSPVSCLSTIRFSCVENTRMTVQSCGGALDYNLRCVREWHVSNRKYLIVRNNRVTDDDSATPLMTCLALREVGGHIEVVEDGLCLSQPQPDPLMQALSGHVLQYAGSCQTTRNTTISLDHNAGCVHRWGFIPGLILTFLLSSM